MRAPTTGNMKMYSVSVITGSVKKQRLSETCDRQPFIANAPAVIVFVADMQRWFGYYHLCGPRAEGTRVQGPQRDRPAPLR